MLRIPRISFPPSPRLSIALIFLIRGFIIGNWFPRIPGLVERLEIPSSVLGIIWFLLAAGCIVSFAIAAKLMKRSGSARAILYFAIPYPIILTLVSLAPNVWLFGLGVIVYGLMAGGFDVSTSVQGGVVERATRRPLVSSLYGFFSLGTLTGSFVSGIIAQAKVPIPLQFAVLGAFSIPLFIYLHRRLLADEMREVAPPKVKRRFRLNLPPRVLWPLGALVLCVSLGEESINNWVALYMRQDLGSNPAIAGFAYTAFAIATFTGRIMGDVVMQRFGVDRILMSGSLLAASGIGFGILVNQPWALLIGFAAVGAGLSVVVPVTYRRAGEVPGMSAASAVATVASIGYLGFLVGPILIGFIADLFSLRVAFTMIAMSLVGIFVMVRLSPSESAPSPVPELMPALPLSLPEQENPLSL
jgi:MFS family permease